MHLFPRLLLMVTLMSCLMLCANSDSRLVRGRSRSVGARSYAYQALQSSWAIWNSTQVTLVEGYCYVSTSFAANDLCSETDKVVRVGGYAGEGDPAPGVVSAMSSLTSCAVEPACQDCDVTHTPINPGASSVPQDQPMEEVDVSSDILTMAQWYQWCDYQFRRAAGETSLNGTHIVLFLSVDNATGLLNLCGYDDLSCTADNCFVGLDLSRLALNDTMACSLPEETESGQHRVFAILLATIVGSLFLVVLIVALVCCIRRARASARDDLMFTSIPQYKPLRIFDDSITSSDSEQEDGIY